MMMDVEFDAVYVEYDWEIVPEERPLGLDDNKDYEDSDDDDEQEVVEFDTHYKL